MIQIESVLKELQTAIYTKRPFSLVRCGDGEAIVLNGVSNRPRLNKMIYNHFGYTIDDASIEAIRKELSEAFQAADIIGIPYDHYLRGRNYFWRENINILNRNCNLQPRTQFCSMNTHLDFLFQDKFKDLLTGLPVLGCITPHRITSKFSEHFNISGIVSHIQIPGEAKYFPELVINPHYPIEFEKVRRSISQMVSPGELWLVGGGILGKIYCKWIKDQGGVAFDIGSVFDRWSGYLTRGPGKSQRYDNVYKL